MVSGNLTAIECQRSAVQDAAAIAGSVAANDLTFAFRDGQYAVVHDDTAVSHGTRQCAVDGVSVQFENNSLPFGNGQGGIAALGRDVLRQLDNAAVVHGALKGCPARDVTGLLVHADACVLTLKLRDLSVLHSDMQCLGSHARFCRQQHLECIGI